MYRNKKMIMIVGLVLLATVSIIYAAFSTTLNINGTFNIGSTWKIIFLNIDINDSSSGATEVTSPNVSGTSGLKLDFNVDLKAPGDYIQYKVLVSNRGTLDARVEQILATTKSDTEEGNSIFNIEVSGIEEGYVLKNRKAKTFYITVSYNEDVTTPPDIETANKKLSLELKFVQNTVG